MDSEPAIKLKYQLPAVERTIYLANAARERAIGPMDGRGAFDALSRYTRWVAMWLSRHYVRR
jgi:hypothetical protein